jgi:hypothetical protein
MKTIDLHYSIFSAVEKNDPFGGKNGMCTKFLSDLYFPEVLTTRYKMAAQFKV